MTITICNENNELPGMYMDGDRDDLIIINPAEVLRSRDLEVTQEAMFSVYARAVTMLKDTGVEVLLIEETGAPSIKGMADANS